MHIRRACRLTGAATFTGIGSYAIYEGYNQGVFAKIRPRGAPRSAQMTVAVGVGGLPTASDRRGRLGTLTAASIGRSGAREASDIAATVASTSTCRRPICCFTRCRIALRAAKSGIPDPWPGCYTTAQLEIPLLKYGRTLALMGSVTRYRARDCAVSNVAGSQPRIKASCV